MSNPNPEQPQGSLLDERAERMYGKNVVAGALKHTLQGNIDQIRDHQGLTAEQTKALGESHVKAMEGALNSNDAAAVHSLISHYTVKPASDEDVAEWAPKARKQIREVYGADADKLMKGAIDLVNKNPELKKLLEDTGLGAHPKVVKAIVDRVRYLSGRRPL